MSRSSLFEADIRAVLDECMRIAVRAWMENLTDDLLGNVARLRYRERHRLVRLLRRRSEGRA